MFEVRSTCVHLTSIVRPELDLRENAVTMIVLQIWSVSEVEMSDYNKALRCLKRNAALGEKGKEKNSNNLEVFHSCLFTIASACHLSGESTLHSNQKGYRLRVGFLATLLITSSSVNSV